MPPSPEDPACACSEGSTREEGAASGAAGPAWAAACCCAAARLLTASTVAACRAVASLASRLLQVRRTRSPFTS